jgi:hypothetical protein
MSLPPHPPPPPFHFFVDSLSIDVRSRTIFCFVVRMCDGFWKLRGQVWRRRNYPRARRVW